MANTLPEQQIEGQAIVPSEMDSADWAAVNQWTRERSFWMARVTQHEILQEMRNLAEATLEGEIGEGEAYYQWLEKLDELKYQPEEGQEGGIHDLRSVQRFMIALRTNVATMQGWADKRNGLSEGPLMASPARELVRVVDSKQPREWLKRWADAGGKLYGGRMIAPKLSDVWRRLGDAEDGLKNDYPPFAWGSGMGWEAVNSIEARDLGVMTMEEILEQAKQAESERVLSSPGESLQTKPRLTDEDLRNSLGESLGGLAKWEGDELIYTDPNGTREASQDEIVDLWETGLPESIQGGGLRGMRQLSAFISFAMDTLSDVQLIDDVTRLFKRIVNDSDPSAVHRVIEVDESEVDPFITSVRENGYAVGRDKAGERWIEGNPSSTSGDKWKVVIKHDSPSGKAFKQIAKLSAYIAKIGISPQSIISGEWILREGFSFGVRLVDKDRERKIVTITLKEGAK